MSTIIDFDEKLKKRTIDFCNDELNWHLSEAEPDEYADETLAELRLLFDLGDEWNAKKYAKIFIEDMKEQIETLPNKNVEGQLKVVSADIAARKTVDIQITAITKAQMAMYHKRLADRWLRKDTALSYTVNNDCIHCGICTKVCPTNNITLTENGVQFSDHCEVCYACLHNCPQHAIHMPLEAGTTQFRNEHVTLSDIISANE